MIRVRDAPHNSILDIEYELLAKIKYSEIRLCDAPRYNIFNIKGVWDDPEAYGVSHVGWGLNTAARYEALTMYDQRDTNGTELRALAGNFLFSTGANEAADRHTLGHFDLPMLRCSIALDGLLVVENGKLAN